MTILKDALPNTNLGFGIYYCPKMLAATYGNGQWGELELKDTQNLELHPGAKVLHYAQEIFEGLKAYKLENGELAMFRPQANISRMSRSAELMSMPTFPEDKFLDGLSVLVKECSAFAPDAPGALYIRPTMIATTPSLGVQPATDYLFYVLICPVGGYFGTAHADKPVQVSVLATDDFTRAVRGGIGAAKTGGNYAASLRAIQHAKQHGYNNVLFLDAIEKTYLEELGGMNIFAVIHGELHTPKLTDTILSGITRNSILELAKQKNIKTVERSISITELLEGIRGGEVQELFACGTAAVLTSIQQLGWKNEKIQIADGNIGKITTDLFRDLTDIHYGRRAPQIAEWMLKV